MASDLLTLRKRVDQTRKRLTLLTSERDDLIVARREDGWSVRKIGEHAGLSHVQVLNILKQRGV